MALDNAQFIAELSITDPPGTDPLSQGDDQIRTIKRATQQSFPNIDAAVTLTTAQMNLAAIKNEANVFTAIQTIQDGNLVLNSVIDAARNANWQLAGINTWQFSMRNAAGNNDFHFRRLDALGAFVDNPWECDLTTGIIDFAQVPTVAGAPLWLAGEIRQFIANQGSIGANWFVADGTNGTVNLDNRIMVGQGLSAAGVLLAPNFDGATNSTPATGGTAITASTMPSHRHRIRSGGASGITDVALGNVSTQTVVGANRGNTASQFFDANSGGQQFIENTGSGNAHTHTQAQMGVDQTGGDRNAVRPLSAVVQFHQYVP